jgi:hypothetical protein
MRTASIVTPGSTSNCDAKLMMWGERKERNQIHKLMIDHFRSLSKYKRSCKPVNMEQADDYTHVRGARLDLGAG